jgi:hypothetical protein
MITAQLLTTTMTTELETPVTETTPATKKQNPNASFLGLYIPKTLKEQVEAAAKADHRSMSKFAVLVFEDYFNKK